MTNKFKIKNREGLEIIGLWEPVENSKGIAIVSHGLGGFKEAEHIEMIAKTFNEQNYSVIRYDTTNAFGESGGNYENATTTNHLHDLEDVIEWAKQQKWWQDNPILAGHSLGGFVSVLYAEAHPEEVKALAPFAPVVSGKLSLEAPAHTKESLAEWKRRGYKEEESASKPGVIKRLKWSHNEDRLKYDTLPEARKLTMPVLLVVGTEDLPCPPKHIKLLYDKLSGPKEFHIIKGAPHTYRNPKHLTEIKEILKNWIKNSL